MNNTKPLSTHYLLMSSITSSLADMWPGKPLISSLTSSLAAMWPGKPLELNNVPAEPEPRGKKRKADEFDAIAEIGGKFVLPGCISRKQPKVKAAEMYLDEVMGAEPLPTASKNVWTPFQAEGLRSDFLELAVVSWTSNKRIHIPATPFTRRTRAKTTHPPPPPPPPPMAQVVAAARQQRLRKSTMTWRRTQACRMDVGA